MEIGRNRIARFRKYELCQICVPPPVGMYIVAMKGYLRDRKAKSLYERLKEQSRLSHTYEESSRLQYLRELMFSLGSSVSVYVEKVGERECVPTNYLEREDSSFGYDKVQPCWVLSLTVPFGGNEYRQAYLAMQTIVEGKMRCYKTDFYFHDMLLFSRYLFRKPILWTVSTMHTMTEVLDSEREAVYWAANIERDGVRKMVYEPEDGTWMGCTLRVMSRDDDLFYFHDGATLHKVSREKFKAIHDRHVERAKSMAKEMLLERKAVWNII